MHDFPAPAYPHRQGLFSSHAPCLAFGSFGSDNDGTTRKSGTLLIFGMCWPVGPHVRPVPVTARYGELKSCPYNVMQQTYYSNI